MISGSNGSSSAVLGCSLCRWPWRFLLCLCRVQPVGTGSSSLGYAAVVLVALTLAFSDVQNLGHGATLTLTVGKAFDYGAFWWIFGPSYDLAFRAGLAVLSGWLTLSLIHRWRPAVGWLDR